MDANVDSGATEAVQITVVNNVTGEVEVVTLTETGRSTGVFQGALDTAAGAGAGPDNDGTVNTQGGDTLTASYVDSPDGSGGSRTITATSVVGIVDAILLTKIATRAEVMIGGTVEYVLRAQNTTAGVLSGVILSDRIPGGFKYVQGSAVLVEEGPDMELGTPDDVVTATIPSGVRPLPDRQSPLGEPTIRVTIPPTRKPTIVRRCWPRRRLPARARNRRCASERASCSSSCCS